MAFSDGTIGGYLYMGSHVYTVKNDFYLLLFQILSAVCIS